MSSNRPPDTDTRFIGLIDKPYLSGNRDYLKMTKIKTWEAGAAGDEIEYSEFQKPYGDRDGEEDYPFWEWTWPVPGGGGFLLGPPITWPDPTPNPCSIDEDCIWAGLIGPDEMECDECFTFSQAHLYIGCGMAPELAAFGSFELQTDMVFGRCYLLFGDATGSVIATVCCDDEATGEFTLFYHGFLGCQGSIEVQVSCDECCTDGGTTLTGADTVAAGAVWTGTISPACDGFECRVASNSECVLGCEMNPGGSSVTVGVPAGACGSFTVSVFDDKQGCEAFANKTVRITDGGAWRNCGNAGQGAFCTGPHCGGTQQGPPVPGGQEGAESHYLVVFCWGGGMCLNGNRTVTCDDGYSEFVTTTGYCCNGCQDCTNNWIALSAGLWVWECSGACAT